MFPSVDRTGSLLWKHKGFHNLRKYVAYKTKLKKKQVQSMVLVLEKPALKPSDNSMPPYRTRETDHMGRLLEIYILCSYIHSAMDLLALPSSNRPILLSMKSLTPVMYAARSKSRMISTNSSLEVATGYGSSLNLK